MSVSKTSFEDLNRRISDKLRRIEISTRRLSTDAFHGGVQSRFRGRGMDFDEIREYAPGDDVRAIDWNATARSGGHRAFVKKYREERQLTVVFVVDMSASGGLGAGELTKREQAIEIAAILALAAVRSDHRVGLALFTDSVEHFVPPARGRLHALHLVHDLVSFEPAGRTTNLANALRTVRERLKRRAVVVVLSDLLLGANGLDETMPELALLARRHDVITIRTGDKHDRGLPNVGLLTLEDAETGEVVEVDTSNAKQRARLEAVIRETEERIRMLTRSANVDLLEVDTLRPYLGPLIGFFKARAVRS
ncbi:MAG: hypothetical protein QOI41_2215 [Myxococcales bacterium]|nr:hypothetical protein [Myxococcales bacterium]